MHETLQNILTPHQASALHYKDHVSLTANAGSGKTFVLSRRYLEIALNENISLRNIAAITFTDKAASELYKKIAGEIEQRLSLQPDEALRKKLERIRRELVSANISTIHSFCIDILREYPVEASLDANFQAIDETLSNDLIELSIEEAVKSAFDIPDETEELKYLVRIFASKRIFAGELFSLIKNRKNVYDLSESVYKKTANEIANHFYQAFSDYVEQIFVRKKDDLIKSLIKINNAVLSIDYKNQCAAESAVLIGELKNNLSAEKYLNLVDRLSKLVCTKSGLIKTRNFLPKDLREKYFAEAGYAEKLFKELKNICVTENHRNIELELAGFGKKLIRFFNKSCNLYEEKKKENGYLDFEDILLFTKNILENESVRESVSQKYKFIMVDEYQDTNELQYKIFLPILNYLKEGNLFVVGDEKQSIYMFRDAELEVFSQTKKNIEDVSGKEFLLTLPDSFRMSPEICLFTNYLFNNLFREANDFYNEVKYSELVCARNDGVKGKIEILIGDEEDSEKSEPELVAKKIISLISGNENNINWSDIAVLVRKRKNFDDLEKVFTRYKIPFNVIGGTGFYQKQSVYDIYNYFNFLLDKNNDAALVGILRSPFFNISDARIFEISREKESGYWNKLQAYSKFNPEIQDIIKVLNDNFAFIKSYEPTILLRKILNETNYLSVLASKRDGPQELANIEKLINLTTAFNRQPFRTAYDYINFLKESIEKTPDESQASVIADSDLEGQAGTVKIMTLHQAKGLEFRAVFLYKCDDYSQLSAVRSKEIIAAKKTGILAKVPLNENYFSEYETAPVINIYNHIAKKKDLAEIKRLFYVGVTRAKDFLFISASYRKSYNENSFIGLLAEGLNLNFESEEYRISSSLKYLIKEEESYITKSETLQLLLPVIKQIGEKKEAENIAGEIFFPAKLNLKEITDFPEGEIISATKLSLYYQCPLKYQLTYEFGFTRLMEQFRHLQSDWKDYDKIQPDFNASEENISSEESDTHQFGNIKGRIIHKILQKEIDKEDIRAAVEELINDELSLFDKKNFPRKNFIEDIVFDLNKFYDSATYLRILELKNYRNEFEVYCKEDGLFLFGIIDRIAIEEKKAIIIDFKTDDIDENEIKKRFESYLTQLKFYSYIVSRLYNHIDEFELRIIFIKYPDKENCLKVYRNEMEEIKNAVKKMAAETRSGIFERNISHCQTCIFSGKDGCLVN